MAEHSEPTAAVADAPTETSPVKAEETKDVKSEEAEEKKSDGNDDKLGSTKESHKTGGKDDRPVKNLAERREQQERLRNAYKEGRKNVRTDFEALPETDDPDEIRKQVEFYFSDSNLAYDDHMRSRVLGNKENNYGENFSVPIKDIHSFKRMKRFQPYSAVVAALKESKTLDVVGDQDDEIRRKVALEKPAGEDQEFGDPTIPRAIYAKGFGEEGSTTQFDIEAFFTPYGPLNSVRLRRSFPERHFKGSVFVEFESEELQKEFLAIDPKPKFEGRDLLIKSKRQYCDEKMEDVKSGKIQPNKRPLNFKGYYQDNNRNYNNNGSNGRGGGRGSGRGGRGGRGGNRDRDGNRDRRDRHGRDDRDRDDWRGRREDFQKNGNRDRRRRDDGGDSDEFGRDAKSAKKDGKDYDNNKNDNKGEETREGKGAETASAETGAASKKRERDEDAAESEAKKAKGEE